MSEARQPRGEDEDFEEAGISHTLHELDQLFEQLSLTDFTHQRIGKRSHYGF